MTNSGPARYGKVFKKKCQRHFLLMAGNHARWLGHRILEKMWVCAKLDFDLEGNFQGQMW
jgi:hypothetical protein